MGLNNDSWTYTLQIRDTNQHDLPDTNGDDGASYENNGGEGLRVSTDKTTLAKVVNTHDQSLDVQLHGTTHDDEGMAADVADTTTKTVASGGGTAVLTTDTPWDYVRVTLKAATAPASGDVTVVYQEEE